MLVLVVTRWKMVSLHEHEHVIRIKLNVFTANRHYVNVMLKQAAAGTSGHIFDVAF